MRRIARWSVLLIGLCLAGCDLNLPVPSDGAQPVTPTASIPAPPAAPPSDTIRIASFNIQVFGTSKLGKPQAMDVLVKTIRRFDVVAVQEVRSTDQTVVPRFVELINAEGARYDFVVGPRLGRTSSKEQYAFIFNTDRIEIDPASVYTVDDPQDFLHREPLVARFRVRGVSPDQAFTFTLANIHTDPDETGTELDALADVFVAVQRNGSGEDDVILLGDLNVDEYHLGRLGQLAGMAYAISGTTTNTRRNAMYDNLVFSGVATSEYVGRYGVLDLMQEYGLAEAAALEVSDHCPIWAEFSIYESGLVPIVAARPDAPTR